VSEFWALPRSTARRAKPVSQSGSELFQTSLARRRCDEPCASAELRQREDAAKLGRLALFVELVNHQRREVWDSKSVQDAESFVSLQSRGAQNYIVPRVDTLRDTILAEASLKTDWLKSALVGPYRSNLFADSAILSLIGGPSYDSEA